MRTLIWGRSFIRAFKRRVKRTPKLRKAIEETLHLLADDPFTPRLASHKLKGKLSGSWACTVDYDLRIVFDFVEEEDSEFAAVLLMNIGTHDEVY